MSYRKLHASQLFTGSEFLRGESVLVLGEEGVIEAIIPISEAGDEVESFQGILCPGFINAHCHIELSHMKAVIPEGTGMTAFIMAVMKERQRPEQEILAAIEAAETAMLNNGIVAVGDICNTAISLHQKQQGLLYYHNFIECTGFVPATAQNRFNQSVEVFNKFAPNYGIPVSSVSLVPHAPYSVSPELFHLVTNFPGNQLLTMHNQESIDEALFFQEKKGDLISLYNQLNIDLSFFTPPHQSSLQSVLPHFRNNQTVILVHNVNTTTSDLEAIKKSNIKFSDCYLCLCPNANKYIGNGLPDVDVLVNSGVAIVVGTDSLASNHQLSILEELKTLHASFPHIPISQLLQWATLNGAKALQLDEILGSFEVGKQPGVLLLEGEGLDENTVVRRLE
jgi:aminodeoxyfutalosine deaminase